MRRRKRPFQKRKKGRRILLVTVTISVIIGLLALDCHIIQLIKQYARTKAEWYATRMINEAVTEVLAAVQPQYDTLVNVSKDTAGNVISVQADIGIINQLKAALSLEIAQRAGDMQQITASVPLGTFLGSHFFAGRGPAVHIPVSASVSVLSDFDSTLTAAGINQTEHRILLNVKTTVFLAVPTAHTSVEVESAFIIAESVLLGKVPDAYTVVENVDKETVGEIFDYGADMQN